MFLEDDSCEGGIFSKNGNSNSAKKRRKSRTAFTNQQIYELEKRFLYQKYLTPADRDEIASQLGLSNAQVITWFQNRRAKLKRDIEELKADVTAAKVIGSAKESSQAAMLSRLEDLQMLSASGGKLKNWDKKQLKQLTPRMRQTGVDVGGTFSPVPEVPGNVEEPLGHKSCDSSSSSASDDVIDYSNASYRLQREGVTPESTSRHDVIESDDDNQSDVSIDVWRH